MQFSLSSASLESWTGSVLAVGLVESDASGLVEQLESRLELAIKPWLEQRRFKGKSGEVASLQVLKPGLSSLVFVGLGSAESVTLETLRGAAAKAISASAAMPSPTTCPNASNCWAPARLARRPPWPL